MMYKILVEQTGLFVLSDIPDWDSTGKTPEDLSNYLEELKSLDSLSRCFAAQAVF